MLNKLNKFNKILMMIFIVIVIGTVVLLFTTRQKKSNEYSAWTNHSDSQQSTKIDINQVVSNTPINHEDEDLIEIISSVFTNEEKDTLEFTQFVEIVESPEYTEFIETKPETLGSFFNFFESQGFPVNMDNMMSVFLELAPVGTPEELENRARITLSQKFQEIPYSIHSARGVETIQSIIEEFFEEKENVSWMMIHFNGNFVEFGDWIVDVIKNPVDFDKKPEFNIEKKHIVNETDKADIEKSIPLEVESFKKLNDTAEDINILNDKPDKSDNIYIEDNVRNLRKYQEDIENMFRVTFDDNEYTKDEIYNAIQVIILFGEDEGIEHIKKLNPEMAERLGQIISNKNKYRRRK